MRLCLSFSLLAVLMGAASAFADAVYTCTSHSREMAIMEVTQDGQRVSLTSVYHEVHFVQSKRPPRDPGLSDYLVYHGRYPAGDGGYAIGTIYVQSNLVRGEQTTRNSDGAVGSMLLEGDDFQCKAGREKLKPTPHSTRHSRREPCRLTSYYEGMTFMPPRVVCNYGNGIVSITGGGRF